VSLYFIFITIAIDAIGLGIVIPVLPQIMSRFFNDANQSSLYYGYFVAIYAFMQFLSAPLLGLLSDRFGRRPILLLSLFGAFIDYMIMAYAQTLPLLFFGRMISGISGASFTVANAFIADISDDTNRSRNFGLIGAGFGLGFILGPALGGILGSTDSSTPFLAAAILNLLNFSKPIQLILSRLPCF
jgi:DHA1 family tetracycline resistance protein-like MFS transporter